MSVPDPDNYFSRPLPADEFEQLLRMGRRLPPVSVPDPDNLSVPVCV